MPVRSDNSDGRTFDSRGILCALEAVIATPLTLAAISRPGPQHGAVPTEGRLAPWADQIYQWLTGGSLQLTRVQELLAQRGCTAPGEVAEVDFGRLRLVHEPDTGRRRTGLHRRPRPGSPPQGQPQGEGGCSTVRERFFKGGDFDGMAHLRAEAARWCRDIAGMTVTAPPGVSP